MESIGILHVKRNNTEIINSYKLELGKNTVGRNSPEKPSTIEIDDDTKLSRQHFIIKVTQNEDDTFNYLLQDNNSLNGTQIISGKKKRTLNNDEEIRLENKDIIKAGEKFLFELEIPTSEEQKTDKIPKSDLKPIKGKISVPITDKGKTVHEIIACEQILGIQADGNYAYLYITAGEENRIIWANKNLKYFENLLQNESYFLRIHDKYIVNANIIKSYNIEGKDGRITLIENIKIDKRNALQVSRTYKDSCEKLLAIHFKNFSSNDLD